jgi:hypothetical protein
MEQAWFTHTEGKVISDLQAEGLLAGGRRLAFDGIHPPCIGCQRIMQEASEQFGMRILYLDKTGAEWVWQDGVLIGAP